MVSKFGKDTVGVLFHDQKKFESDYMLESRVVEDSGESFEDLKALAL